jgi:hypothetical protein
MQDYNINTLKTRFLLLKDIDKLYFTLSREKQKEMPLNFAA